MFQALTIFDIAVQILILMLLFNCPNLTKNLTFGFVLIVLDFAAIMVIQMFKNVFDANQNEENDITKQIPHDFE